MSVYPTGTATVNADPSSKGTSAQADNEIDPVMDLLGSGRIVAHRVDLALAVGSTTAGLLLSQFWFWTRTPTAQKRNGWFWMTIEQISEQTGLSYEEQMTARKRLVKIGVLEEQKKGNPMKLWYRVKLPELIQILREYVEVKTKLWAKPNAEHSGIPNAEDTGNPIDGNPEPYVSGMPKDRFGQLRKIARGKTQGLTEVITKDITEMSPSMSSPISLSSPLPEETDPSHKCDPQGDRDPDDETLSLFPEMQAPDTPMVNQGNRAQAEQETALMLWTATLGELANRVNVPTMETHFRSLTPIRYADGKLTLGAKTSFTRGWIEQRHRPLIEEIAAQFACETVAVQLMTLQEGAVANG